MANIEKVSIEIEQHQAAQRDYYAIADDRYEIDIIARKAVVLCHSPW